MATEQQRAQGQVTERVATEQQRAQVLDNFLAIINPRTCRALASPSQLLFFRFSPDGIDKSILSGLVACAELCKIFLLVCRCCKITFPFSGVMFRTHIRMKERVRKGPSLPWGTCPHKRRNGKISGIHESQVLPWCGPDHVYVMSMHGSS